MKKKILGLSLISLFLISCSGEAKKTENETMEETAIVEVDSVAVEMHQATEDIEKTSEELDELMNEL